MESDGVRVDLGIDSSGDYDVGLEDTTGPEQELFEEQEDFE
jgi:hypothetical protein